MTNSLGIKCIVEGAEQADDVAYLKRIQATYAQGFHLGKPSLVREPTPL